MPQIWSIIISSLQVVLSKGDHRLFSGGGPNMYMIALRNGVSPPQAEFFLIHVYEQ